MLRENPANEVAVGLLSFLIVWISDAVNIFYSIQTRNSCTCHMHEESIWATFDTFSRRVDFIMMVFQELPSLLSAEKPFPGDLEGYKVTPQTCQWKRVPTHASIYLDVLSTCSSHVQYGELIACQSFSKYGQLFFCK